MAGRVSDWYFSNGKDFDGVSEQVEEVGSAAAAHGRRVRFGLNGSLIARDTEAEARETLVLAHPRCGDTSARLAAGFGIGLATVRRYIHEAVRLLAALAPELSKAMKVASRKTCVILDGTPLPIDRIAADGPYCSGNTSATA